METPRWVDIHIPDPNFRAVVIKEAYKCLHPITTRIARKILGSEVTEEEVKRISVLDCSNAGIVDLTGLGNLKDLIRLNLSHNRLGENKGALNPLRRLSTTRYVRFPSPCNTPAEEIALREDADDMPKRVRERLSGGYSKIIGEDPPKLMWLNLEGNAIQEISPLSKLSNLTDLHLKGNRIADIAPIVELSRLIRVDLRNNPLNRTSVDALIPVLEDRGVEVIY